MVLNGPKKLEVLKERQLPILRRGSGCLHAGAAEIHGTWAVPEALDPRPLNLNIGASIITYTILGVPYYNYSTMGPKTLF